MWQKLKRIDSFDLEKARIQLLNAIQLVCAPARCYINSETNSRSDRLIWNTESLAMDSNVFGVKEKVRTSLDIHQFVISIFGSKDHAEHLVLSGITYPMAFGWMQVKLESFHLEVGLFNDRADYAIERALHPDEELTVTNQEVFDLLAIYYSNANYILSKITSELNIDGEIRINPSNLNLELTSAENSFVPGFSPGDKSFPEPYFYIQFHKIDDNMLYQMSKSIGIWNNKYWKGLVLLACEFFSIEPEHEKSNVIDFFTKNYWRLIKH